MTALELILIVVCMAGSWFFSGIETGIISINRLRLRHLVRRKVPGADVLQRFLDRPDELFGTTLVGNNLVNTVLSVVVVSMSTRWLGAAGSWVGSAVATILLLTLCEYFPKSWFQSFPAKRCLPFAPLLAVVARLFRPLARVLMGLIRTVLPTPGTDRQAAQPVVTREELVHLAHEGQKSGALTPEESRMIHSVIELKTITCEEIMIPRDQVVYVHHDTSADDIRLFARAKAYNQFPVMDRITQAFVGVVYIFDVLADESPGGKCAKDYMRPPQLVSRKIPVDHVLPRMRVTRQPLVLVAGEGNEIAGIVTLDLVLQEIVGA
jgi:putative hemolysin